MLADDIITTIDNDIEVDELVDLVDADTYQDASEPELAVCYECQEITI